MASKDYTKIANKYIQDVLAEKIPACKFVKQACERQQADLKRKKWKYSFDKEKAARVCRFIEQLPHIKGIWAGKPIVLEPWQIFLLTTVFGWVDVKGLRRFKTAYVEVPRKNAKSTLSSGVALYLLCADNEGGPEVYSAATTRDQAKIVWDDAKKMVERCPDLREYFGVQTSAHSVYVSQNAGVLKALSRDQGGNLDGLNVHGAVVDELHAHKTRDVWDVLETATGARSQPLIWGITTAGFNRSGICYEQRAYSIKILDKVHEDEEYFGIIFTVDDTDDWADPKAWAKANPNWGISVSPEDIARKARKALEMAAATNNFLTKHLNMWVNADTAWMNMKDWDACADYSLKLEDFEGDPCYVGCDLATKKDIAAALFLFPKDGYFYVFGKYYLHEEAVEGGENSHYAGWARQGLFTLTPGNITDFDFIENDLDEVARIQNLVSMGIDPYQAMQLINRLRAKGVQVEEYQQQVRYMSEPMKQLEALVRSGKLRHNGDPVLAWMISNVVCHTDVKENIYPRKEFPQNKIDGAVALIIALGMYLADAEDGDSVYETRGILTL